jgi:Tfp pilus tip-associated adhesin PilY1
MSRSYLLVPIRIAMAAFVATIALTLLPQGSLVLAGTYTPCQLPAVVGSSVKPNVVIVQDMSGSMQDTAYYSSNLSSYYTTSKRAYSGSAVCPLSGLTAFDITSGYYGTADTDWYYKYNASGNATGGYFELLTGSDAPALRVQFTAASQQGSSSSEITFTATGHGLAVGDYAAFYDLSSHTNMNGDAYKVTAVSGDSFTVSATWNGSADTVAGQVVKRVISGATFSTGVDGTVLNFLLTSRTCAAMKALFGGRAVTNDGDYYYLQYQGLTRYVADETLGCLAFIRAGTTANPDYYASGTYYGAGTTADPYKDMYMTVSNFWKGTLTANNASSAKGGSTHKAQVYSFTLTSAAKVTIRMFPAANDWVPLVYLYSGSTPSTSTYKSSATGSTSSPAVLTYSCSAGKYSIEATNNVAGTYKSYYLTVTIEDESTVSRGSDPNVTLTKSTTDTYHNGVLYTSTVGSILNAQCRVQQPVANRAGVIQNSFSSVRFGFLYYKSDSTSNYGKMLVGCDNTDQDVLINAMSGIGSQTVNSTTIDFTSCYPYYGTPTASGLQAAYNYLSQTNTYTGIATNTAFYAKRATITDPYYGPETDSSATPTAVICRKSYVLLVSDGEYTDGTGEPCTPALKMHASDLRTDLDNPTTVTTSGTTSVPQTATVYSIFAFSNTTSGSNSMKAIAMFGAFTDVSGCGSTGYPYSTTAVPSDSRTLTWPRTGYCAPSGVYNTTCCAEWDTTWTRSGEETDAQKGIPDTYYEASGGAQLEAALKAVLQQVVSRDASSSAVATVSQQLSSGDTVVRGVFEATDPDNTAKFLWYGHLEAYWPFTPSSSSTSTVYDFDLTCNDGLRCEEIPDSTCSYSKAHCWDAAVILRKRDITKDARTVFTSSYSSTTGKWSKLVFNTTNITATLLGLTGTTADTDAENLVKWTLGEAISGLRVRADSLSDEQNRLGDIVYSTPVVGGPPSPGAVSSNDPNISEFYSYRNQTWATTIGCKDRTCTSGSGKSEVLYRDKVVYVGSNDGMVHAFLLAKYDATNKKWLDQPTNYSSDSDRTHDDIGREMWAYIPSNMLKHLSALADTGYGSTSTGGCVHRTMVDLSDQVFEVYIEPPDDTSTTQREWRSVLIGGERGGGDTYFALDVTDPYNPIVLWEYSVIKDRVVYYSSKWYQPFEVAYDSMSNFPMSWTQPALGRLNLPDVKYYVGAPNSSGAVTDTETLSFSTTDTDDKKMRHVVFAGGGIHLFDASFTTSPTLPAAYTDAQWSAFKAALFKPSLIVLDIATGKNLFKYIWPTVVNTGGTTVFPTIDRDGTDIPYSMCDAVAIDVWDPATGSISDDGFTDRVYMGDITGRFYGVKFTSPTATTAGIQVDIWKTKTISDSTELASNLLRATREPISQSPSISFESSTSNKNPKLVIIFAAGKYEDVTGSVDDKTDLRKTSLYNLRDAPAAPTLSEATDVLGTGFKIAITEKCSTSSLKTGCTWVKSDGTADCCENSCDSSCYACVYDLTLPTKSGPAERFTAKPLIAGGYVFATSFLPSSDPCEFTGTGYLYVFSYSCEALSSTVEIVSSSDTSGLTVTSLSSTSGSESSITGVQVSLGSGMPSKPVLDSSGKNVIVQMSDGTLLRVPVTLATKPVQVLGWQEK